jgi:signal transduction histidine kinase
LLFGAFVAAAAKNKNQPMLPKPQLLCEMPSLDAKSVPSALALRERDQRLEAFKELVAHVAHDVNNSLVPLVGYFNLLKEELKPGVPGSQYMAKLDLCMRKTDRLIEILLKATHPEREYSPKSLDLTALLRHCLEVWIKALPPTAQISIETDLVPCSLWLDENQWTKLIQHLLGNAECALVDGGVLKLSLKSQTLTPERAAELDIADTNVFEFVVEDTGCGMTEEVLQRACEPFFTSRSGSPTTGLGLTLVHSVVRLQGGQIVLESAEEAGTRVRIWLLANGG